MLGFRYLRRPFFVSLLAAFSVGCVPAAEKTDQAKPDPAQAEVRANTFIHEIIPYWQKRLQLDDWNILVMMSRQTDLRPGTLGNIHWDSEHKTATIRVLDAADYSIPFAAALKDMEFTVVHELIHLELASLPISDANRSDQEYAINHIAEALLQSTR